MPDQSEAPIVRKLLGKVSGKRYGAPYYVNPNGPEAAEIIRLCEEAIDSLLADHKGGRDRHKGLCCDAADLGIAALAQIKGQNP